MPVNDDLPQLAFESAEAWEAWLADHHESTGVWLKIAKKASGLPTVTYAEALDVALCFGWIDGQKMGHDDSWFLQRFTPRRSRSTWSQINVEHIARLESEGRMHAAGRAEVEAAKADGRWEAAYGGMASIEVPDDLRAALDENADAGAFFDTISRTNRYSVLYRVQDAKRPATRAKRIAELVAMLAEHRTFH
jgi:uncharacterized protein YdeI (YjbR/CyaY-like superfamily)